MIRLAQNWSDGQRVRYTAVDPFELRAEEAGPGLTLKEAYRKLKATGRGSRLSREILWPPCLAWPTR